ncbi:MAG: hypothetical protein KKD47_06175, partial [Proteobacteria bacterium]|nr:hypothetical protein [Pseudomonadota bacterium]
MKSMKTVFLSLLAIVQLSGAAWSQSSSNDPSKAFGLRAGYGTNPDQFVIGAQAVLGRTVGFVRFAPSVDLGFGDDMT